jgi:hypothetical protein
MSINQFNQKIKPFLNIILITEICLILAIFCYFYIKNQQKSLLNIKTKSEILNQSVFGSKTGKTYYFPWCGSLSRIKKENIVEFRSVATAIESGYRPAKNCKGL